MYTNKIYADVNEALPNLLWMLDSAGEEVGSRAGRTRELTHVGITLTNPVNREILLPARKPNLAAQIAETMWILNGRSDIGWLENYLPRVRDFSDDGETWRAGYGARLRHWESRSTPTGFHGPDVDQIAWVVDHLRKDPASRRAVLSIWDPSLDTADGVKDIPCNDWISFSSRLGRLDLHVAIRSNDVIWGWSGINQFEWSVLLEVVAGLLGLEVGSLHFSTTSFHIYDRHWAKSVKIQEHAYRVTGVDPSPRFDASVLVTRDMKGLDDLMGLWMLCEKSIRNGDMNEREVANFPEPMMRSWLRVLQWWWSGEREYLSTLEGTRLERATRYSVQPPERERVSVFSMESPEPVATYLAKSVTVGKIAVGGHTVIRPEGVMSSFLSSLCDLHLEKEEAYGGSWKKRGELFSILPNIGRKVDRLGTGGETDDETSADTAGDLFVYLAKYKTWLDDQRFFQGQSAPQKGTSSDHATEANKVMLKVEELVEGRSVPDAEYLKDNLVEMYETLLEKVEAKDGRRAQWVEVMMSSAYMLARLLWERENAISSPDEYRGADRD